MDWKKGDGLVPALEELEEVRIVVGRMVSGGRLKNPGSGRGWVVAMKVTCM
jgi:hypothetical protein